MDFHNPIHVIMVIVITFLAAELFWNKPISSVVSKETEPESDNLPDHPYRAAATVDSYEEHNAVRPCGDLTCACNPNPIKKKREPIMLPKSMVVFMLLAPAMLVDIGLGFAYDSPAIGVGAKWGMFAAGVITNMFFIVSAIVKAEEKK